MTSEPERTGVLVVRVWTDGANRSLRARITSTLDVDGDAEVRQAAASAEQILTAVKEWIEAFVAE